MSDCDKVTQTRLRPNAVEAIGRGHLIKRLVCEGIGVSLPLWDDGVDLIAHTTDEKRFEAVPLQLKVSTNTYVGIDHKYEKKPKMKFVFIWLDNQNEPDHIFVMGYGKLEKMFARHSGTSSLKAGKYHTSHASPEKQKFMAQFEVTDSRPLRTLIFS